MRNNAKFARKANVSNFDFVCFESRFAVVLFLGAAAGTAEPSAASKTGKYIAPGLREGAANRRGETMPRQRQGRL